MRTTLKRAGIFFLASLILSCTIAWIGIVYAADDAIETGVIGDAGYVYSVQGTETGCTITVKNGTSRLYILAKYNGGLQDKWNEEVHSLTFPTDKTSVPLDLYWGSKPTGVYSKLISVVMEKNTKTGLWEVHTEDEVYTANAEALGLWTTDMTGTASADIKAMSDSICMGLANDYDKALAIHDWICANIYYNKDGGYDIIGKIDPDKVLRDRTTHCGGNAELFQAMCHAQDIPCVTVYGTTTEAGNLLAAAKNPAAKIAARFWTHGWNECYADNRWVIVDCTWDSGLEIHKGVKYDNDVGHAYFDCNLTFFSATHLALSRSGEVTEAPALWSKNMVLEAMQEGFLPDEMIGRYGSAVTRGEFCNLAVRMLEQVYGKPASGILKDRGLKAGSFNDTSDPAILAANAMGIVSGYGNGQFNPNGKLSRQEAAAILMRTAKFMGITSTAVTNRFNDRAECGAWANEAIAFVSDTGIMQGVGDNCFDPLGGYTREQSIVTMVRLFEMA